MWSKNSLSCTPNHYLVFLLYFHNVSIENNPRHRKSIPVFYQFYSAILNCTGTGRQAGMCYIQRRVHRGLSPSCPARPVWICAFLFSRSKSEHATVVRIGAGQPWDGGLDVAQGCLNSRPLQHNCVNTVGLALARK